MLADKETYQPSLIIIGADLQRGLCLGEQFAQLGYRVLLTEQRDEIGPAILKRMPDAIVLDYTLHAHEEMLTPDYIASFLTGDELHCAPPLFVLADNQTQSLAPHSLDICRIMLPTSFEVLCAIVEECLQ
jgi:UDP-galactopyranose mutase